jgi:hypothetical protein
MPNERTKSFLINYDLLQLMGTGVFFTFQYYANCHLAETVKLFRTGFIQSLCKTCPV